MISDGVKEIIEEEVCEKELERQRYQKEGYRIMKEFDVGHGKEYYSDDKKTRFVQFHVHKADDKEMYRISAKEQKLVECKKRIFRRKTIYTYSDWVRHDLAEIWPSEKKVVVKSEFFYKYFKEKAETLDYTKLIKCWEGAT